MWLNLCWEYLPLIRDLMIPVIAIFFPENSFPEHFNIDKTKNEADR